MGLGEYLLIPSSQLQLRERDISSRERESQKLETHFSTFNVGPLPCTTVHWRHSKWVARSRSQLSHRACTKPYQMIGSLAQLLDAGSGLRGASLQIGTLVNGARAAT